MSFRFSRKGRCRRFASKGSRRPGVSWGGGGGCICRVYIRDGVRADGNEPFHVGVFRRSDFDRSASFSIRKRNDVPECEYIAIEYTKSTSGGAIRMFAYPRRRKKKQKPKNHRTRSRFGFSATEKRFHFSRNRAPTTSRSKLD